MNLGTPPTAPKARTGEFTPPGITSRARSKSSSLWSLKVTPRRRRRGTQAAAARRGAEPARGADAERRRRGGHEAVPAVPAQALGDALRLAVQAARPPFVLVGG